MQTIDRPGTAAACWKQKSTIYWTILQHPVMHSDISITDSYPNTEYTTRYFTIFMTSLVVLDHRFVEAILQDLGGASLSLSLSLSKSLRVACEAPRASSQTLKP